MSTAEIDSEDFYRSDNWNIIVKARRTGLIPKGESIPCSFVYFASGFLSAVREIGSLDFVGSLFFEVFSQSCYWN
jgi:hypothetical protein